MGDVVGVFLISRIFGQVLEKFAVVVYEDEVPMVSLDLVVGNDDNLGGAQVELLLVRDPAEFFKQRREDVLLGEKGLFLPLYDELDLKTEVGLECLKIVSGQFVTEVWVECIVVLFALQNLDEEVDEVVVDVVVLVESLNIDALQTDLLIINDLGLVPSELLFKTTLQLVLEEDLLVLELQLVLAWKESGETEVGLLEKLGQLFGPEVGGKRGRGEREGSIEEKGDDRLLLVEVGRVESEDGELLLLYSKKLFVHQRAFHY